MKSAVGEQQLQYLKCDLHSFGLSCGYHRQNTVETVWIAVTTDSKHRKSCQRLWQQLCQTCLVWKYNWLVIADSIALLQDFSLHVW